MRNDSSAPRARCSTFFALLTALLLAGFSSSLHAQCSDQDDPGAVDCQLQQPVNTSTPTGESPAALSLTQAQQQQPRADRSNEATASGSLSTGSTYTEQPTLDQPSLQNRAMQFARRPEPPTEFQKFVFASTGQMLPVYGADLFADRPAAFGPINNAPAPANLLIAAGDQLRIRIWGQVNFSANLVVSREGEIYLPKVGAVHVAGLTLTQSQEHLRQSLDRIYRNFELSVDMGEIHSIQVYMAGQARRPGEYTVSALSTLVNAVFASGGPSAAGSMRHVELRRGGKTVTDFDLYALLVRGDKSGDMQLEPGDVLYIPAVGPQAALLGSVHQPGIYELRGQEPLSAVLDAAGGATAMADGARISVDRISGDRVSGAGHAQRSAFEFTADAARPSAALADGDIVRVDPIESTYHDTVTLSGSVANPGRYRWYSGMHLSDLLPNREALLARGYWWRRTQLGFPAPEFVSAADQQSSASRSGGSSSAGGEPPSGGRQYTAPQPTTGGFAGSGSSHQPDAPDQSDSPAAMLSPALQTNWNYAVIERLNPDTMATSLISFDLGKLVLDHDAAQDHELMAGDVVTVFSQDDVHPPVDQRTKYVQLDGEVVDAGVYSVHPGETLRTLVMRAGGLTSKAYLYGAEFTRRSTQAIEQQRMNEYADRLEHNIDRSSLTLNQEIDTGGSGMLNPAASVNRDLVTRLRQLRARGRIVLNLAPGSHSAADLPDIPLEDGDKLVIPATPSTIQVIGAVFNQNAFLYHSAARASEYLRYAGGPMREADRGQIFILRADGSVSSRGEKQSIFAAGNFENARLYPGDTIVVPEKIVRPSALRDLTAWTQVMSQLAISAAAIDVIK
jgi:protein involved in polysaccharide export with SLBB domain